MNTEEITATLPKYFEILRGERKPRFKQDPSALERNVEMAFAMLGDCTLCERECHVNRQEGELGYCRSGAELAVSGNFATNQDLSFLVPSYAVFFVGCTMRCQYCQNWENAQAVVEKDKLTEKELAANIDRHGECKNIDFVGGEPVPQLPFFLKILSYVQRDIPVFWHSNFYASPGGMKLLSGAVDVYTPTFKYGNDLCAKRLSGVKNYTKIVRRNLVLAAEDSEVLIRHLVLPNHTECCSKPVLDFIDARFGDKVLIHLMSGYAPAWKAREIPGLNRALRKNEFDEVIGYAEKKKLRHVEG